MIRLLQKETTPVELHITTSPAHSVLIALKTVAQNQNNLEEEPWLKQFAAKLFVDELKTLKEIFEDIDPDLIPGKEYAIFADYLSDIDLKSAEAFPFLKQMWRSHFMPVWDRQHYLQSLADNLNTREWPTRVKSAESVVKAFLRRPVPTFIGRELGGVTKLVFCLSPFVEFQAAKFDSDSTLWIFVPSDPKKLPMRYEPIQRSEVTRLASALADEARLQILEMLAAYGPMRSQEIMEQLDVSQPTVSRQLKQLKMTQFMFEKRDGDASKIFELNNDRLGEVTHLLETLLSTANARMVLNDPRLDQPAELRKFLNEDGQIHRYPNKMQAQQLLIGYLATKIEKGVKYSEKEINALLNEWHTYKDPARLRRDLVDFGVMERTADGAEYWLL